MARRRGLGLVDSDHYKEAERHYREAKTDFDRLPSTCYGGVKMMQRIDENIGRAKAHAWSADDRKPISGLMGNINRLANAASTVTNDIANKCGVGGRWR